MFLPSSQHLSIIHIYFKETFHVYIPHFPFLFQVSIAVITPQPSTECNHCIMFMEFMCQELGQGRTEVVGLCTKMSGSLLQRLPSLPDVEVTGWLGQESSGDVFAHVSHVMLVVGQNTYPGLLHVDWASSPRGSLRPLTWQLMAAKAKAPREPGRSGMACYELPWMPHTATCTLSPGLAQIQEGEAQTPPHSGKNVQDTL